MIFYIWIIVSFLLFSVFSYMIGRETSTEEEKTGMFFVSFVASLLWPVLLALAIILGPFYLPYKLGQYHRDREKNQKEMWDTLKK